MNFLLYISLIVFGFFYHISSSEFWPITISKTWLDLNNFEYSLLQKPLFGMFLSLFHLLPLTDVTHLYLVKLVFSIIGLSGLICFFKFLLEFTDSKIDKKHTSLLICLLLLISPTLFHNFFRIRTDQISFLVFSLALLYNNRKQYLKSMLCCFILPLISLKSLIFFILGLLILYPVIHRYFTNLTKKYKFYSIMLSIGLMCWLLNFYMFGIIYFVETFKTKVFPNAFLKNFLNCEILIISASIISSLLILYNGKLKHKPYALSALSVFFIILVVPQSYPYLIASLIPLLYLPTLIIILTSNKISRNRLLLLPAAQLIIILILLFNQKIILYNSSQRQLEYIKQVSNLISKNNLNYLDGTGILPKQNFKPCFISPDDEISNTQCKNYLNKTNTDVVIVTSRLNYLGSELYTVLNQYYSQVLPGFWVKKEFKNLFSQFNESDLTKSEPAIFLFGFN